MRSTTKFKEREMKKSFFKSLESKPHPGAVIIVSIVCVAQLFAGGIPVIDGAANTQLQNQTMQQIMEYAKEAKRWIETTQHYKSELDAYAKQLASQTGIRDTVAFLKDVKKLYEEGISVYEEGKDAVQSASDMLEGDNLSSAAKELMEKYLGADICDLDDEFQKQICLQRTQSTFQDSIMFAQESKKIGSSMKDIIKLSERLTRSKDIKETADIQAAISAKQALIEAQRGQIELYRLRQMKAKEFRHLKRSRMEIEATKKYIKESE